MIYVICASSCSFLLYLDPQKSHLKEFANWCIYWVFRDVSLCASFICLVRLSALVKDLSHFSHWGPFLFWMLCTLFIFRFRVLSAVNNLLQVSQEYLWGESLCSPWWWFKPTRLANDLGHLPHLKGFSSRICSFFSWYLLIAESAKIL